MTRAAVLWPAMVAALLALAPAASARGPVAPIGEVEQGARYQCPEIAARAPATAFFDNPVYQGDDGWFFRIGNDVTDFTMQAPQVVEMMARFAAVLKRKGVTLVYVPIPTRAMTDRRHLPPGIDDAVAYDADLAGRQFSAMVATLGDAGITTVDLMAAIRSEPADGDFHFARDTHWRPRGAKLTAKAVAALPEVRAALDGVGRKTYASTELTEVALNSPMRRAIQDLCAGTVDAEAFAPYATEQTDVSAEDLLGGGDDDVAPVVLVGTSYSDLREFNFAGFLSDALQVDVADYAISGGGTYTSMLQWTHSDAMTGPLPRLLLWENPVAYRLDANGVAAFRQLIPAVEGSCAGEGSLFHARLGVGAGNAASAVLPDDLVASGHRYYLALSLSDPHVRNLRLSLDMRDGDGEDVAISRPDRMADTPRAFVELNDDFSSPLHRVTVSAPVATPVDVDLDVCKSEGP